MESKIDLHIHSTASDGIRSPIEIVDWAVEKGLRVIAITDHDILLGSKKAIDYARDKNVEVVSGVEIGADDLDIGVSDVHVVGLFVNLEDEGLASLIKSLQESRTKQKVLMIKKLNSLGYTITFEEVIKESGKGSVGRPHLARVLIRKYPREFKDINDVFEKLIGMGKSASVPQKKNNMKYIIETIKNAGGVAILAHPGFYFDKMEKIIERFVEVGGDGIEVDYNYGRTHKEIREGAERLREKIRGIAEKKGLLISGGTDYHHDADSEVGSFGVSETEFEKLKELHSKRIDF